MFWSKYCGKVDVKVGNYGRSKRVPKIYYKLLSSKNLTTALLAFSISL